MSREDRPHVQSIAAFIAARLQHPAPECNSPGNPWVSTIKVSQHKEKFWRARVYCRLAEPELVKAKWAWAQNRWWEWLEGLSSWPPSQMSGLDAARPDPTDEFRVRCLAMDASHYRQVHMDMVALRPSARDEICMSADHGELLHPTFKEVDEFVTRRDVAGDMMIEHLVKKYGVKDVSGLRAFLRVVYDPTPEDRLALRD